MYVFPTCFEPRNGSKGRWNRKFNEAGKKFKAPYHGHFYVLGSNRAKIESNNLFLVRYIFITPRKIYKSSDVLEREEQTE